MIIAPRYTYEEKLEAVRRELRYRRNVYARRVAAGDMDQKFADRQIALFEAIEADYVKAAATERLI
jgi:hypothetical protein